MNPIDITRGSGPVILAMPHSGLYVPDQIRGLLNETGRQLADTDWHVDRLYEDLLEDVTIVRANFHRYVIDANRDPSGKSLYPGQNTTGLCPVTDFFGTPIYREGCEPNDAEIAKRKDDFHAPYHAALRVEIERIYAAHGVAVLYDCHSIRSRLPFLFEGVLPDLNIGTNDGASCAPEFAQAVLDRFACGSDYTSVLNGRFKGGWTTRHYGQPATGIHAIQMELSQATYMSETPPWTYDPAKADKLRALLKDVLQSISESAHFVAGK